MGIKSAIKSSLPANNMILYIEKSLKISQEDESNKIGNQHTKWVAYRLTLN